MISLMTARRMRLRTSLPAAGSCQAKGRSAPHSKQRLSLLRSQARWRLSVQSIELGLLARDLRQPRVPSALKFAGDQAVAGVDSIELALSPRRLEACLLQSQLQLPALCLIVPGMLLDGLKRGLNAKRTQCRQHLRRDHLVNPQRAERDAALQGPMVDGSTLAVVARRVAVAAAISDVQLACAVPAAQQAGQQGLAATQ